EWRSLGRHGQTEPDSHIKAAESRFLHRWNVGGKRCARSRCHGERPKFSFSHERKKWPRGTKGDGNPPAHHVGNNGRWTPVGNILNINVCHVFEKLSGEMGRRPRASMPIRQFGWLGASQRNKVLHSLGWHLVVD